LIVKIIIIIPSTVIVTSSGKIYSLHLMFGGKPGMGAPKVGKKNIQTRKIHPNCLGAAKTRLCPISPIRAELKWVLLMLQY